MRIDDVGLDADYYIRDDDAEDEAGAAATMALVAQVNIQRMQEIGSLKVK